MDKIPKTFLLIGGIIACLNILGHLIIFQKKDVTDKDSSNEEKINLSDTEINAQTKKYKKYIIWFSFYYWLIFDIIDQERKT